MLEIRLAQPQDATALSKLARHTFVESFAQFNTPENMDQYLRENFSPTRQRSEIENPQRKIAIVWHAEEAIGFYHLVRGETIQCVSGTRPIQLLKFYIDSKWHGKSVAKMLMDHCIEECRRENFSTLWLGVWEQNFRAQTFYRKYAFKEVGTFDFILGEDRQIDLVMVKPI